MGGALKPIRWACLIAGSLCLTSVVRAQKPAAPEYQILRYEKNWSAFADPAARPDAWDRWKYVPLRHRDWFLTLAGEARERYEVLNHPNFGSGPSDENGYLLQRYLLSGDFYLGLGSLANCRAD